MDYLTDENEELVALHENLATVERTLRTIADNLSDVSCREHYLTGEETCRLLHISPRTLQSLRDKRVIPFTIVGERTILYPESKLYEMLMRNYRPGKDACK
ncbi:MAG: helix-turn-helix domain-containing protein [Alistipes sp.]|uniref:helix-turn-helix domain-containing protein n=1 Tax=uncultured Bacteroides sp. TaxID=162156 RepID=UPI00260C5DF4|nr:helix-turn-helix domain-containing protein [uncultured Bacteroides sp.]